MTAIAIWRNDETEGHPVLWAAADSQVSNQHNTQLIGDAVKICSLPVLCRRPGPSGFLTDTYFVQTFGYCFAGSTLMGQNTYLGLLPLLSNIRSVAPYVPLLADIAHQVRAYLKMTFDGYRQTGFENALFEVALFGHCPRNDRPEIFYFRTEIVGEAYEVTMTVHQNLQTHDFVYLGSERAAITGEIAAAFATDPVSGRPTSRAPRHVIEDRIASGNSPSIGGDLQLAIADRFGFRPLALSKPRVPGQPEAYLSYLGYELTGDLVTIGEAIAMPDGMI
jgi:hypothetical protein